MSGRVPPRGDLSALEGYHSPQLDVSVRLNTNESPFAPPAEFVDRWLDEIRGAPLNRYPDRDARELRDALAKQIGQPSERLFCANGSNEVLQTLLLTYGGPGRRVLTFEPTYALHSHIARITGTEVVSGERSDDFTIDVASAQTLIADTSPTIVFACSPNNPTGTVEPVATVEALLDATDGFVVVDEAYGEFAPRSTLERVDDDGRLIVVRTYSKVWSLAAVRLGFAVAPTWVVDELEKVVLPYHLSLPTQAAGRVALEWSDEMAARVDALVSERERVLAALRGIGAITVFDSGANFVLFRVHGGGHALWEQLVRRGVLVRDCSSWPRLAECLRVTVGSPDENDAFLAALTASIAELET